MVLFLSILQSSHLSHGSENALRGKDTAFSPVTLTPLLLDDHVDRIDSQATSTSKPTPKPTFVHHKYGGTYTQEEVDKAHAFFDGSLNPEEYAV